MPTGELNHIIHTDIYLIDQILKGRYSSGGKLLDAGCGGGRNISWFVLQPNFDIYAIDNDRDSITHLLQVYPSLKQEQVKCTPLQSLPFPDSFFDHIICSAVLHFAPNKEMFLQMLSELNRVLKPGGVVLLSVPINAPLHGEPWHFFHFTHYGVWRLAEQAGLEMVSCEKLGGTFWSVGKHLADAFRKWMKQHDPTRARKRGQNLGFCLLMNLLLVVPWLICFPFSAFIVRPIFYWLDRTDIEKKNTSGYTIVLRKPRAL